MRHFHIERYFLPILNNLFSFHHVRLLYSHAIYMLLILPSINILLLLLFICSLLFIYPFLSFLIFFFLFLSLFSLPSSVTHTDTCLDMMKRIYIEYLLALPLQRWMPIYFVMPSHFHHFLPSFCFLLFSSHYETD